MGYYFEVQLYDSADSPSYEANTDGLALHAVDVLFLDVTLSGPFTRAIERF